MFTSKTATALIARTPFTSIDNMLHAFKQSEDSALSHAINDMMSSLFRVDSAEGSIMRETVNLERYTAEHVKSVREGSGYVDVTFLLSSARRIDDWNTERKEFADRFMAMNSLVVKMLKELDFDTIVDLGVEEHGMVREARA